MGNRHAICRFSAYRITRESLSGVPVAPPSPSSRTAAPEFARWWRFFFYRADSLLEELALGFRLGQGQIFLIRGPSLGGPAESAAHICTRGMRQIIIGQFAVFQHRVDMRQSGLRTIAHCDCHGAI